MRDFLSADCLAAAALTGIAAAAALVILIRPAQRSARVSRERGTIFLPEGIMHGGYSLVEPLIRWAVARGMPPDAITWMSLAPGVGSGIAVAVGRPGLGAWLLALSGLCDLIDGAVARASGRDSAAGAALDSILDRYVEFCFLAGLVWFFDGWPLVQLLTMAALFGSFMVTYSTAKAEALGVIPPRGWMKRPERIVWLIASAILAGLAPVAGWSPRPILAFGIGILAVFTNLSAGLRLAALRRSVQIG